MTAKRKYCRIAFSWGLVFGVLVLTQTGAAQGAAQFVGPQSTFPPDEGYPPARRPPRYPAIVRENPVASEPSSPVSSGAFAPAGPPGVASNWMLTFADEFNSAALDQNKWAREYGFDTYCVVDSPPPEGVPSYCNRSNNDEKEWYVDDAPRLENGILKLVARKNDCSGDNLPDRNYLPYTCENFPYLSGMVSTHNRFSQLYGYFEARIKVLNGQGFWPAFWLIPQLPPEIDVMENRGQEPHVIHMTHHYSGVYPDPGSKLNDWSYGGSVNGTFSGPDYSSAFHIYAVDWEPGLIIWYIDGVERSRSTFRLPPGRVNPPDYRGDMQIILNLAVGGGFVDQLLPPDASLPAAMQVDYVRVYQKVLRRVFLPYVGRDGNSQ